MDEIKFEIKLEREQTVGLVGSALLIVGCFAPIVHLPIVGSISYIGNGSGDGVYVVALAIVSAVLLLIRAYPWVLASATGTSGLCVYTLWHFLSLGSQMRSDIATNLKDNPFAGLAAKFADAVSLGWGWAFLLIGILCLFASVGMALLKQSTASTRAVTSPPSTEPFFKENGAALRSASSSEKPRSSFGQRQ